MFEQIIGHEEVKKEIVNHLEKDIISHAYLFCGNQGVGKFLFAQSFAKAILCSEEKYYCGVCQSCNVFDAKTHSDFLLIEDEKSIKVKDIINLTDFIIKKPILGEKKVVIINDAEKMTVQAQNKLLKTFEEPPLYAVIILIINNEYNIISTIKSRGYEVQFKPLCNLEIGKILTMKFGSEKKWDQLSRFSQGSILKALQNIGDEDFIMIKELPEKIFEAIINQDELQGLELIKKIENISNKSVDLIEYMLTWLRDISILKKNRQSDFILYSTNRQSLLRQSNYFDMKLVMKFIEILEETKQYIWNNVNISVTLNYCLIKIQEEYYEYSNRRKI